MFGLAVQDCVRQHSRCLSLKWQRSSDDFVEQRPEGEDVRARIEFLTPYLLRGHIRGGAHRTPGSGQRFCHCDRWCIGTHFNLLQFRESEVKDLTLAVL